MAVSMKIETITPEIAAKYLKRNVDNYRKISRAKAALYAEEMKSGGWQLNGEAIVFDKTGRLKNGQHRLAAIMMAGVPVEMTVISGIEDDVMIYDNGMNRSTKQMAQASGYGDITGTEAAAGALIVGAFNSKVPKGKVLAYLKDHYAELRRAYRVCGANNKRNLSSRAGCVLATYMALQLEECKVYDLEVFFKVFNTGNVIGTDGYEPSSALVARRQFEERFKGMPQDKKRLMEQVEIILMALADFKKNKTRQMNYQVREPMICVERMTKLRKKEGLVESLEDK